MGVIEHNDGRNVALQSRAKQTMMATNRPEVEALARKLSPACASARAGIPIANTRRRIFDYHALYSAR
jgi:hypothetical protein